MLKEIDITKMAEPLLGWFETARRPLPWRADKDPYRIWVSEIMLQQTRIETVIPYYDRFMKALPDVAALSCCEDDALMKLWEGLGYYSRARNLKKAAVAVMEDHGGVMPTTYEGLLSLPGIGPYTAGAIASMAYDEPAPAVDGNVLRVFARAADDDRDVLAAPLKRELEAALREAMRRLIEEGGAGRFSPGAFNQALMELGERVCLPNAEPGCDGCPWKGLCLAKKRGRVGELPVRIKKTARRLERRTILIILDGERVLLRKRGDAGLLAGLYEPLNLPGALTEREAVEEARKHSLDPLRIERLPDATHLFSHIRWEMTGYRIRVADASAYPGREGCFFAERAGVRNAYSIPGAYAKFMKYALPAASPDSLREPRGSV